MWPLCSTSKIQSQRGDSLIHFQSSYSINFQLYKLMIVFLSIMSFIILILKKAIIKITRSNGLLYILLVIVTAEPFFKQLFPVETYV